MSEQCLSKAVLKRARFCIFSKTAPNTLPEYNDDVDFNYYFFNDNMGAWSGLSPHGLTAGVRNAKSDFPDDYKQYFVDDANVVTNYAHPKVLEIIEPWTPPGTHSILSTFKTAMQVESKLYMLGAFFPFDDVSLGITKRRGRPLPHALDEIPGISNEWYDQAFACLPAPTVVFSKDSTDTDAKARVLLANKLYTAAGAELADLAEKMVADAAEWANSCEDGAGPSDKVSSWEVLRPDGSGRVFIWSPAGAAWTALSFFPLPSTIPDLVRNQFRA